jgi:hypothetical protein
LKTAPDRAQERMTRKAPAGRAGRRHSLRHAGGYPVLALRDAAAPLVSVEAAWVDRSARRVEGAG